MTRKKQQKSKKQNPGVFISNLLGGARSTQATSAGDKQSTDPCSPLVLARRTNEGKNSLANAESVVLCKTVLELALVNIALSGQPPGHIGPRDIGHKNIMAPVPSVSSSTSSGQSGLSKLMSPVQDLGKSLLGFLIGSPPPNTAQPPAPASSEPSVSSRRTSGVPPAWETSASVPPTSPGRQRPPGHPALGPSVGSTPVVIRRNKVVRTETLSLASDPASVKTSTVTEEPEEAAVKAMPRNQSQNSRRKKNRRGETQDDKQKPSEATLSTSPPQEAVTKPSRSQSRNSRRRKAKRAAVAAAAAASPLCHQDNEDAVDHETGSEKTETVSFDSVSGVQLSQGPIVTNEIVNTRSHETSYQGGPADSHDLEDCGDSSKEFTVNDTPSEIVMKRKSYKQFSAQNIEDEQAAGFVTARNSVIAECHESDAPLCPGAEHCDISVAEVNPGQSNCHTAEKSSEEVKEIKRKEVLDIQDDPDKTTREVAEQPGSVKISDEASREEGSVDGNGHQSCTDPSNDNIPATSGPPPPPPLPPQGFLLEGLKLDRKDSVIQEDKLIAPKSSGTLRKNKQLSRKDLLINQLSVVDDSFASFLKTQLNIAVDPRERTEAPPPTGTLSRKKKERRKRTESECSASGQDSHHPGAEIVAKTNPEQQNSECLVSGSDTAVSQQSTDNKVDSSENVHSEKCKQRSSEIVDKRKCASNARDRPISIIDIAEGTGKQERTVIETTPDTPATTVTDLQSVDNAVSQCPPPEPEPVLEKADITSEEKPVKRPPSVTEEIIPAIMRTESVASHPPPVSGVMGVTHSQEFAKQHLSKSDSGYSGQEYVEDTDEAPEDVSPAKTELSVDQALRKYDRIVEQKSVTDIIKSKNKPRGRVLSEGSEFSEDISESELDSQAEEEGKFCLVS